MKTFLVRAAVALLLVLAFVAPAAAAPWCATYCSCDIPCWKQCYDEGGASACLNYICSDFCLAAAPADSEEALMQALAQLELATPAAAEPADAPPAAPAAES